MTSAPPTFSVILPVYNRAHSVGRALISVLDQTHPPDEVIVVDDGSTDDLDQALAPFADRIVLLRQANAGVSAARNAGAARARGDWLTFQDSDDVWSPDHLAICARDLTEAPADIVCHIGDVTYRGDGYAETLFAIKRRSFPADTAERVEHPLGLVISGMTLQGAAIRRAAFDRLGGLDRDMRFMEDTALFCQLALEGPFLVTGSVLCDIERLPGDTVALTTAAEARQVYRNGMALRVLEGIDMGRVSAAEELMVRRMLSGARLRLATSMGRAERSAARRLIWRSAREHHEPLRGWIKAFVALLLGHRGVAALGRRGPSLDRR